MAFSAIEAASSFPQYNSYRADGQKSRKLGIRKNGAHEHENLDGESVQTHARRVDL